MCIVGVNQYAKMATIYTSVTVWTNTGTTSPGYPDEI
jgi:hypothetical protein